MKRYNPKAIETKWQKIWESNELYKADDKSAKPKYYALSFFPYPSGIGLHIGHTRNFTITDVMARFKRMTGYEVLHPMGWDSFGLPAENYAIKTGIPPQQSTKENTDNFRRQCKRLGLSIDWDREFSSTDPNYYKWTQWFFLLLYKRGLAYQKESEQFWCDICKTVLANEQVVNGCCWRHEDTPVTKKKLKQWFFKIIDFAERLLDDLEDLDWPEGIKLMQRNWIGKSKGAEVNFTVVKSELENRNKQLEDKKIKIFTTRPDTLFGATFMVLAPEHPLVKSITTEERREQVEKYIKQAQTKTDVDRMDENREKTGVFTGAYAINPVNNEKIPVWIADYVLMGYGTGAIMAVPAHDERDWEFAKKYKIEIRKVVSSNEKEEKCFAGEGKIINSGKYNGMDSADMREKILADLQKRDVAEEKVNYKIRDWLISRQRYWGAPIPIVHCNKCGVVPVPENQLPVELPPLKDYQPSDDGRSPLAKVKNWVETKCPKCGGPAKRETDTMDGFACSSWYFLRFADAHNDKKPFDKKLAEHWLPVDLYVGGAEHAVMHLLYARMWTKVMQDAGLISFSEPFKALRNQGMLLAEDGQKISKSKGNDIRPEEIMDQGYGADALRVAITFIAPYDQSTPWNSDGVAGAFRFLQRVWMLAQEVADAKPVNAPVDNLEVNEAVLMRAVNKATKKVTEDISNMNFNTALSALMTLMNEMQKIKVDLPIDVANSTWKEYIKVMARLLAPFAPHLAEEIWHELGHDVSINLEPWPNWDDSLIQDELLTIVVQVNGKVRANLEVSKDTSKEEIIKLAKEDANVLKYIKDKKILKEIYVPRKLVNFVTLSD
ncbi:leucine--tRNA ligase [Candidatus Saccharibacteria bacterium CPR2]|nr:leucine--tRNA ligase [Candidatus Saccharibacteria bacterium CPR2]